MNEEKKSKTTTPWQAYLPQQLSEKAWQKMKQMGLTSESQFVCMAMKFYLDNSK